jgi:hypothetical protein
MVNPRRLAATCALLGIVFYSACAHVSADALVMTQAMKATTIAEVFVERDAVRVELEIGAEDLQAFRNILPDEVYQRLGNKPVPLAERSRQFFQRDFACLPDEFGPLAGRIVRVEPRSRLARDEITGEPMPANGDQRKTVIFAEFVYPFDSQPDTLLIKPPSGKDEKRPLADIGFAAYHLGLPVNDFRYLAREETLELDWEDPWYSFFHNRNLGRRYNAPASAFLYVEHFEVRKEIIIRPRDLQNWIDLGLAGETRISDQRRADVKRRAVNFLMDHGQVTIDGQRVEPTLDRVHFVRQSLRRTSIVEPDEELDVASAMLGMIFVYPTNGLPQNVTMAWDLFGHKIKELPTMAVDEAGPMPYKLSPDDPTLRWHNFLTNPTVPSMMSVSTPPAAPTIRIPVVTAICSVAVFFMIVAAFLKLICRKSVPRKLVFATACLVVVGCVFLPIARANVRNPFSRPSKMSQQDAEAVLEALLHNTYRAFDRRDENLVYDRLEKSVAGELLSDVYIQMRRSMKLEYQGGARVKIKSIILEDVQQLEEGMDGRASFRCRWTASGSVGHWGHVHRRTNRYDGVLEIKAIDGEWKLVALELNDAIRS